MQENFQRPLTTLKAKAPRLSRCGAYALLVWQDSNTRHPQGGVGGECRWQSNNDKDWNRHLEDSLQRRKPTRQFHQ